MSETTQRSSLLQRETVVDTDVHLVVPEEFLTDYVDEPWRSRIEHSYLGQSPVDGWDRTLGGKIDMDLESVFTAENIDERLCGDFGIDYPVLNTFGLMSRMPEGDYAVALMRAHNDYLLDKFLGEFNHFRALATITTQYPDKAAEEIDRLGDEDDIVGIYVHNTGPNPPLGDPRYDQIWAAAEDNGLNVAFHGSANGFMYEFPRQNQALNRFLSVHVLAHPWSHMLTLTSLIVQGVPEKFPDLEFAFLESGLSWVPFMMFRLNKEYAIRRSEAPLLEQSPEAYIRDRCYFATQPIGEPMDPAHLNALMEVIGSDSLLFATDFPHWDFDHPEALDKHLRRDFSDDQRDQLLADNAAGLFDIPL